MSHLTPETRALLARLGIQAPTVPTAPPSSSTTIQPPQPTTTEPPATPAQAVSAVPATREAAKAAAKIEKPKPEKKAKAPKAKSHRKDSAPARRPAPRPTLSPLSRPGTVSVNGLYLSGETPICPECDVEYADNGWDAWVCPGCEHELGADIVNNAFEETKNPNFGRVIIPEAHVTAMDADLDALGLDASILADATKGRRPTDEQIIVVQACRRMQPGDALRLIAYAGAGKTSTLKLAGAVLGGSGIYLAFNRVIAKEGEKAFGAAGITSKTCHSVAYGALGLRGELPKQNSDWVRGYVPNGWLDAGACADVRPDRQAALTAKAFSKFAASDATAPTVYHVADALDDAGFAPPRETPADKSQRRKADRRAEQRSALEPLIFRQVTALWDAIYGGDGDGWRRAGKSLSFDAYLKVFERSPAVVRSAFRSFGFVLLDEAQDVNRVQISIVEQARRAGCKLVAVGDRFQQIYSWRGAVDALEILSGKALYLSASFRFGERVAAFSAHILSTRPGGGLPVPLRGLGPAGTVVAVEKVVAPVILCRTNAGVVRAAGTAALSGQTVHVVGGVKEISQELESILALQRGEQHRVMVDLLKRFPDWKSLEDEAAATEDPDLTYFVELGKDTKLAEMIEAIRSMERPEKQASLIVSTAHKAKGREWDVVGLSDDFPGPNRAWRRYHMAVQKHDDSGMKSAIEEWHVLYVAATRAKKELRVARRLHDDILGIDSRMDKPSEE